MTTLCWSLGRSSILHRQDRCAWSFSLGEGFFKAHHLDGLLQLFKGGKWWAVKYLKGVWNGLSRFFGDKNFVQKIFSWAFFFSFPGLQGVWWAFWLAMHTYACQWSQSISSMLVYNGKDDRCTLLHFQIFCRCCTKVIINITPDKWHWLLRQDLRIVFVCSHLKWM